MDLQKITTLLFEFVCLYCFCTACTISVVLLPYVSCRSFWTSPCTRTGGIVRMQVDKFGIQQCLGRARMVHECLSVGHKQCHKVGLQCGFQMTGLQSCYCLQNPAGNLRLPQWNQPGLLLTIALPLLKLFSSFLYFYIKFQCTRLMVCINSLLMYCVIVWTNN